MIGKCNLHWAIAAALALLAGLRHANAALARVARWKIMVPRTFSRPKRSNSPIWFSGTASRCLAGSKSTLFLPMTGDLGLWGGFRRERRDSGQRMPNQGGWGRNCIGHMHKTPRNCRSRIKFGSDMQLLIGEASPVWAENPLTCSNPGRALIVRNQSFYGWFKFRQRWGQKTLLYKGDVGPAGRRIGEMLCGQNTFF